MNFKRALIESTQRDTDTLANKNRQIPTLSDLEKKLQQVTTHKSIFMSGRMAEPHSFNDTFQRSMNEVQSHDSTKESINFDTTMF